MIIKLRHLKVLSNSNNDSDKNVNNVGNNNNSKNPLNNETQMKCINSTRNQVLILVDSIARNLKGFFLTKKL